MAMFPVCFFFFSCHSSFICLYHFSFHIQQLLIFDLSALITAKGKCISVSVLSSEFGVVVDVQAEIELRRDDAESVGVAETTPPALDANDGVALLEHTELEGVADTPLEALVDILLPGNLLEVGLGLVVVEGVDAAVQVRVAGGDGVAGDHDDGADGAVLGDKTGSVAAE